MTDNKVEMRVSFLNYARPTLRISDKVWTTEDWDNAMRLWFDAQDLAIWKAFEAGWKASEREQEKKMGTQ